MKITKVFSEEEKKTPSPTEDNALKEAPNIAPEENLEIIDLNENMIHEPDSESSNALLEVDETFTNVESDYKEKKEDDSIDEKPSQENEDYGTGDLIHRKQLEEEEAAKKKKEAFEKRMNGMTMRVDHFNMSDEEDRKRYQNTINALKMFSSKLMQDQSLESLRTMNDIVTTDRDGNVKILLTWFCNEGDDEIINKYSEENK